MSTSTTAPSTYRLALAHVLRAVGPVLITAGLIGAGSALAEPPTLVRNSLALISLVLLAVCAVLVIRPPRVLVLGDDGYRIWWLSVGVERSVTWKQVETVETRLVGDTASLVFTLDDGRACVLALSLLGARSVEAQRDVHERLNAAHGYRRVDPS